MTGKTMKIIAVIAALAAASTSVGCSLSNDENSSQLLSQTDSSSQNASREDSSAQSSDSSQTSKNTADENLAKTASAASSEDLSYSEEGAVKITFDGTAAQIQGEGASAEEAIVTITRGGTYIISGCASKGRIIVNTDKNSQVKLVFNNADITSEDYAVLSVLEADKVYIITAKDTQNTLTDGESYSLSQDDSNVDAAVFSKADLIVGGTGKLVINANYKHGIVSKDDLTIQDLTLDITSASTAIEGKDSVTILSGDISLSAGSNGVRSTNTEDSSKGYISILGGNFNIVSNGDGFDAQTSLNISGGDFTVKTGGGSENASMKADGTPNDNWQNDMHMGGGRMRMKDNGDMGANAPADMPNMQQTDLQASIYENDTSLDIQLTAAEQSETSSSAKAFKAGSSLTISGGNFNIDSSDDCFHSNGTITFEGSTVKASSGDDGMHADSDLIISDGEIELSKSYEGIEGMTVTISGGNINVTASDDGINCAGGSDTGNADRMGMDQFASQEGVFLKISGGNLTVNASGDGLDSNGDLYIQGGTVYVSGPENAGNGALDYNGTAQITAGTIIACGAMGMEEGFGDESQQCAVLYNFNSVFPADTEFTVKDSEGNVIMSYVPEKSWQSVVFSCEALKQGETYTISAADENQTLTLEDIITSNSTSGGFGGGGMGRMGRF